MRLLVTGITGFVGLHALAFLRATQPRVQVFGLARHARELPGAQVRVAALEEADALARVLAEVEPERVLHLAAQSSPRDSFADPAHTLRVNVLGTANLLEALRQHAPGARVLVVGSGEEYGCAGADGHALREDEALRPLSPYAVSKIAQSYLALQCHLARGMHVVRTRTFNHTGAGRGQGFAESSFARQIVAVERGLRTPVIDVGNLDAVRDFSDVRDVVSAYWALLEAGRPGEVYNVCSGVGVSIRSVLDTLITLAGGGVLTHSDPALMRPADIPALVGDPSRLRADTGWRPRHALDDALRALLEHWRGRPNEELTS